jgi:hypothetical protein
MKLRIALVAASAVILALGACAVSLMIYRPTTTKIPAVFPAGPYSYSAPRVGTVVVASRTTNGNERQFFWTTDSPVVMNSTSCAEWVSGRGLAQQGAVFRVTDTGGVVRGLTITRNIWARAFWVFDFHYWDTTTPGVFTMFNHSNLAAYLRRAPTYPLWFCARVTGREMQFVVWKAGTVRPAWGSISQGGSAVIPVAFGSAPGITGWYVGHLPDGTSAVFSGLSIDGVGSDTTAGLQSTHL